MARIEWDRPGRHLFEAGVDRGVLYPTRSWGFGWNGLTGVNETPANNTVTPYYIDGVKFEDANGTDEFAGTINALTYPDQFEPFLGYGRPKPGLHIDQQPRGMFDFSYRSKIGNDTKGTDYGYKIHIVYNATIQIGTTDRATMGNPVSPTTLSWAFTTKPVKIDGYRHSAHVIIDSRETDKLLLQTIEDRLYGKFGKNPMLPSPDDLVDLYETYKPTGYGHGPFGHTTYGHGSEY